MIKFNKLLISKIISISVALVFFLNTTVYGIDHPLPHKTHLRVPSITKERLVNGLKEVQDVPALDYRIVTPVFNEGRNLEKILQRIKSLGYLDKITFVNDASTDNSREILKRWEAKEGIEVLHLGKNKKKEGAIREVLEMFKRENRLPDKIILMDSDSFISAVNKDNTLDGAIAQALAYMKNNNLKGMAFRMDPLLPEKPNFLQKIQYSEYANNRFWNRMASKQGQIWVINGPGGIFQGDILLDTLRNITINFESGDMLITVKMMEKNYRVGYYTDIKVETIVPNTLRDLFKQRQRWGSGSIKVMWSEKGFYLKQFSRGRILALQALMYMMAYAGIYMLLIGIGNLTIENFIFNSMFWSLFNLTTTLSNKAAWKEEMVFKVFKWTFLSVLLYIPIVVPTKIIGLYQAIKYFIWDEKRNNKEQPDRPAEMVISVPGFDSAPKVFGLGQSGYETVTLPYSTELIAHSNIKGAIHESIGNSLFYQKQTIQGL